MNEIHMPRLISSALLALFMLTGPSAWAQSAGGSPDGLWKFVELDPQTLPEDFSPPFEYLAVSLDETQLAVILADAPRESFGQTPSDVIISVPLPGGEFAEAGVARSFLMEPALAAQFSEIQTYVFHDATSGASGHIALGPGGVHLAFKSEGGLVWVQPVETTAGPVHLSYFDYNRTDGANDYIIVHPDDADEDHQYPVPLVALPQNFGAEEVVAPSLVSSGSQLRIYRLAAATTAEFYQARGGNDLSVLFSLIVDILGTNAVLESEVATRLTIAQASRDVFYDDPMTAPFFNAPPQCSNSNTACTSDSDCDTNNGETCNIRTTCQLRDDNRDNMIALHNGGTLDFSEYDLSVLFAVSRPGVRGGCAWYVVCLEGNTDHKARGMVSAGNGGTGSTSGVLAHEGGHMLGARHTFTGQAGACTLNEFLAGNSESGYEPGSGTTRMSYNGNCRDFDNMGNVIANDNVDVSADPQADQYFHSRSFDEIVQNVFSGDGANCGSLVNTGNAAPLVDAGPDYSIPRQTPFELTTALYFDAQPLLFNWEQYDRAFFPRPIDTDFVSIFGIPDFGPIIRSVPPGTDPSRTVPNLQDLLDGTSVPPQSINRRGEMLPQVDRELNFRFIARDDQMGGGGVAYDTMTITVEGDPFYITYPNEGEQLNAGCQAVATWEVGGSAAHAANVDLYLSDDGGLNFSPLLLSTPNDGGQAVTLACVDSSSVRLKAQGTGNIFFDISDGDFSIAKHEPQIAGATADGEVDEMCEFLVEFQAAVSDDCGVSAADVTVDFTEITGNATLGTPTVQISQQQGSLNVSVDASVLVFGLTASPAAVRIDVSATDNCGLPEEAAYLAYVSDTLPPTIEVALSPDTLWSPNHKMHEITADVTVEDNCGTVSFVIDGVVSDEPDDATGDGSFVNDIEGVDVGTPDQSFQLRAERMGSADGRTYTATYTATDGSDNQASDSALVEVPDNQK